MIPNLAGSKIDWAQHLGLSGPERCGVFAEIATAVKPPKKIGKILGKIVGNHFSAMFFVAELLFPKFPWFIILSL